MAHELPNRPLARRTVDSDREAAFVGSLPGPFAVDVIAPSDDEAIRLENVLRRHGRQLFEIRETILVTERADLDRLAQLVSFETAVCVDLGLAHDADLGIDTALDDLVLSHRWDLHCLADGVFAVTMGTPGKGTAGDREPRRPVTPTSSGAVALDLPSRSAQNS